MRGLCVSGGGSKGAKGAGYIAGLKSIGINWNKYSGTSVGALIVPMVAAELDYDLRQLMCRTSDKDVWKVDPFKKKFLGSAFSWLRGWLKTGHSLGDFSGLRNLIDINFSEQNYVKISSISKEIYLCMAGDDGSIMYIDNNVDYEFFKDAMYASSSPPVFSQGIEIDGVKYFDGGIRDHVPVQPLIDCGCTEIDIIVHRTEFPKPNKVENVLDAASFLLSSLLYDVSYSDIMVSKLQAKGKDVKLNIYYAEAETGNSFSFDPVQMTKWYREGYLDAIATKKTIYKLKQDDKAEFIQGIVPNSLKKFQS